MKTSLREFVFGLVGIGLSCICVACVPSSEIASNPDKVQETSNQNQFDADLFERNINKWRNAGVEDYSFNIDASGFLRPFLPAEIEVRGSQFRSIRLLEPNKNKHW